MSKTGTILHRYIHTNCQFVKHAEYIQTVIHPATQADIQRKETGGLAYIQRVSGIHTEKTHKHTYTHTFIHTDRPTDRHIHVHTTYIHSCIYTHIHTYIHTYIYAYIHTYIHIYCRTV